MALAWRRGYAGGASGQAERIARVRCAKRLTFRYELKTPIAGRDLYFAAMAREVKKVGGERDRRVMGGVGGTHAEVGSEDPPLASGDTAKAQTKIQSKGKAKARV
jgi:hypothetical protein